MTGRAGGGIGWEVWEEEGFDFFRVAISPEQSLGRPRRNSLSIVSSLCLQWSLYKPIFIFLYLFIYFCYGVRMLFLSHVSRVVCTLPWCECVEYLLGRCLSAPIQVSSCMERVCVVECVCTSAYFLVVFIALLSHCEGKGTKSGFFFFNSAHFSECFRKGWIKLFFFFPPVFDGLTFSWNIPSVLNVGPVFGDLF